MECPYNIPFSTSELPNSVGEFWIYDANHRPLFNVDNKEQADYIVQAINSYEKLVDTLRIIVDDHPAGLSTPEPESLVQARQALKESEKP